MTYSLYKCGGTLSKQISDDPVRPELPYNYRIEDNREIYYLENEKKNIGAIICVGYCDGVPTSVEELTEMTNSPPGTYGTTAVFYTVWSYDKGCGREIIFKTSKLLKNEFKVQRFVTLSPKTQMAERFHTKNGAIVLQRNKTTDNFEYLNV